ncbi:MAG: hypothetical protein JWO97_3425 [Acidobacteria bacterium]|nr:hypothetical protein [Acidobacteriota bacterium]
MDWGGWRAARGDLQRVSPTIFRAGPYRFYFFSREEPRMHVHVTSADGEAKFWMEPTIEMAENHGIPARSVGDVRRLIETHEQDIRDAWTSHFGR